MIKKKIKELDVAYCLLAFMAFFPLMPFGVLSICTIVFVTLSVYFFRGNFTFNFKNRKKILFINIAFFIVLCTTILISEDKESAIKFIQRDLNLLIFPTIIILFFPQIKRAYFQKILNVFIVANSIILVMFVYKIIKYTIYNNHLLNFFEFPFRSIIEGKTYLDITPTYLGLWFAFTILCIIKKVINTKQKMYKFGLFLLSLFFYVFIVISSARVVFIALNLSLLIYFFSTKIALKTKIITTFITLTIVLGVLMALQTSKNFTYRYFEEIFKKEIKPPKGRTPRSINIRYGIYSCAVKLAKQNPIFGYGIGDVQKKLNACYKQNYNSSVFKRIKFDTHNYYFNLLLSGGIISLSLFIIMLWFNFKTAFTNYNSLYACFLVLIVVTCLSENILSRAYGSVFFGFFNGLMLVKKNSKQKKTV